MMKTLVEKISAAFTHVGIDMKNIMGKLSNVNVNSKAETDTHSSAQGAYSVAIGADSQATGEKSVAVGYNSTALHANSMAVLGGRTTAENQLMLSDNLTVIGNVAQGKISPDSNEAISGRQLHQVQESLDKVKGGDYKVGNLTTENLNDIKTPGVYAQVANANSLLSRNYPIELAGALQVYPSAYGHMQIYRPFVGGQVFKRNKKTYDLEWEEWSDELATSALRVNGATINVLDDTRGGKTVTGHCVTSLFGIGNTTDMFYLRTPFKMKSLVMWKLKIYGYHLSSGEFEEFYVSGYNYHSSGAIVRSRANIINSTVADRNMWVGFDENENMVVVFGKDKTKYYINLFVDFEVFYGAGWPQNNIPQMSDQKNWELEIVGAAELPTTTAGTNATIKGKEHKNVARIEQVKSLQSTWKTL